MIGKILDWLFVTAPWSIPAVVMTFVSWRIARWTKKLDDTINKVANLPCEEHKSMISKCEVKIANDETVIAATNKRIDDVVLGMAAGFARTQKKRSPYQLNEYGKYVLSESNGDKCVDRNKAFLFEQIENGLHSTPYDIEMGALRAVIDLFGTDNADDVKDFIYNSPDTIILNGEEIPLTRNDVQVAMALYLRDMYINEKGVTTKCNG